MEWIAFTYGNKDQWRSAADRLKVELEQTGMFRSVYAFNEISAAEFVPEWKSHLEFINRNQRGAGYWIWKPLLMHKMITKFPTVGIAYFDAGCELNWNIFSSIRFKSYLSKCANEGAFAFQMKHLENRWTKRDLFEEISIEQLTNPTGQVSASVVFRSPSEIDSLFEEWLQVATAQHYKFLDDSPSFAENIPEFIEHRHDQSILSLLLKKYHVPLSRDESHNPKFLPKFFTPIWAIRNDSGTKQLPGYLKRAENSWFGL